MINDNSDLSEGAQITRVVSAYPQPETFRLDCDPGLQQYELVSLCAAIKYLPYPYSTSLRLSRSAGRRTDFEDHKRARLTYSGLPAANTRRSRFRSIQVARNIQWLCTRITDLVIYMQMYIQPRGSRACPKTKQCGSLRPQEKASFRLLAFLLVLPYIDGEPRFVRMCAIDSSRRILARSPSLLCVHFRTNVSIRMTISIQEFLSTGR